MPSKKQTSAVSRTVISKSSGKPVDVMRSRAAKKAAITRKANAAVVETKRELRLHHKIVAGGLIVAVIVFTALGIRGQLQTYAATAVSKGTFVGLAGKCLDNSGARESNHNRIQLYKCNGTKAQQWVLTSTGSLKADAGSNYCLDIPSNSTAAYTYLQLYKCNDSAAQHFKVANNTLVSKTTNFCATVHYAETANNTKIWVKKCGGTDAQKWVYSGTTVAETPAAPVTGNGSGSGSGSSGGGTVTPASSYNLNTVLNGLTNSGALSLKAGTYSVNNFSYNNDLGVFNKKITGISGAGVSQSVIQMTPNTSTKAGNVPTASGTTNQFYIVRVDGTQQLSNFTIQGTNQGHLYNGLMLYGSTGSKLTNLKVAAIPGNNHFPPGETFGINEFHGNNNVYNNVEIDGAGVGASAFGMNSSANETFNNSSAHGNANSIGWAFWQNTGGATINNSSSYNNRGGVNFERATGTYNLNNMTFGGNTSADISGGQDQNGTFKVIVRDPKFLNGQTKLKVSWFSTEAGVKNKYGKSNIQVLVNGVDKTSTMIQWAGVGAG